MPEQPRWLSSATETANRLKEEFNDDIRKISVRLARHEKSETVNKRHVAEAFQTLSRLGLNRQPWWQRSELESSIGGFLVGASFALPDVIGFFWKQDSSLRTGIVSGAMTAMFLSGVFLAVHGWFRGKA